MFNRNKRIPKLRPSTGLLQAISLRLQSIQRRWADRLQEKTKHWQPRQQKRFLFILCLVMGSCSTLSILKLFRPASNVAMSSGLSTPEPLPPLIHPAPELPAPDVTDTMVFHRFRQHLDSLIRTPEGKKQYERFLKERPGFMDSLDFAEKLSRQSFPHH